MLLTELLNAYDPPETLPNRSFERLSADSRFVLPGDLFIAVTDRYINEAISKGAEAVVTHGESRLEIRQGVLVISLDLSPEKIARIAAQFNDWPARHMRIIGVTGTSGKTSCTQFLARAFQTVDQACGVVGTLGIGIEGVFRPSGLTTPDAITLHNTFAQFLKVGVKRVAMEVSSHALHQGRVDGIQFSVGLFTNLSRDHLDYHADLQEYGDQKKKLFYQSDVAVINANDAFGRSLVPLCQKFIVCGTDRLAGSFLKTLPQDNRVLGRHIRSVDGKFSAVVDTPWGSGNVSVPLPGFFNFENALLVLATLCLEGVPFDKAIDCIAALQPVPGRMQIFGGQGQPYVIVDYAHKPDALKKVLAALREQYQGGHLYCVFGCGGDRDAGKRPLMGEIAAHYADRVILTDDNPRSEDPASIITDIMQGIPEYAQVTVLHDRRLAISDALCAARPGDCVLIAGKGAEETQTVGESILPFSDAAVVKEILSQKIG